jgi:hypothetical protein
MRSPIELSKSLRSSKRKPSPYAHQGVLVRLRHRDDREVTDIAKAAQSDATKVARMLIEEALTARRMKRDQKDATSEVVAKAQREAMADSLLPVTRELKAMRGELQAFNDEFLRTRDEHTETLNYLRRAATRLVMDVVGLHLLMRNYVHTFLQMFLQRAGSKKDASEVNESYSADYKKFMQEGRAEAERLADGDAESLLQKGAQTFYGTDLSGGM